jgi:hypothetical protein
MTGWVPALAEAVTGCSSFDEVLFVSAPLSSWHSESGTEEEGHLLVLKLS